MYAVKACSMAIAGFHWATLEQDLQLPQHSAFSGVTPCFTVTESGCGVMKPL